MKIDWKALSQSTGYRSLKAAYTRDCAKAGKSSSPMRKKAESLKLFNWVIARAKHYSVRTGTSLESVLIGMEQGRDYWWLNYYQDCKQPKLPSGKPRNVQYMRHETYLRKQYRGSKDSGERFIKNLRSKRTREAKEARKQLGKAARWSPQRKKEAAFLREYRKKNL